MRIPSVDAARPEGAGEDQARWTGVAEAVKEYTGAEAVPVRKTEPYFGSVRFFKNLILLVVMVLIAVPTVLAFQLGLTVRAQRGELAELTVQYSAEAAERTLLEEQIAQAQRQTQQKQEAAGGEQAEVPAYQALYPDFYAPGPIPDSTAEAGVMYLTFDDGPSARTPEILSILADEGIQATFFVVGKDDAQSIAWMKQIAGEGHTLGMHSYTHEYAQVYESVERFLDDYYKLFTLLRDEVGVTPSIFRFPGGSLNSYNMELYQEIIAEMLRRGFVFFDWNLSAGDASASAPSVDRITEGIVDGAAGRSRGIVLMHDSWDKHNTVAALPGIIDGLREEGFAFQALSRAVRPIVFAYPK